MSIEVSIEAQGSRAAAASHQAPLLFLSPGQCQFCLRVSTGQQPMIAGCLGLICDDCARSAVRLLGAGAPQAAADSPADRQVCTHLERHFAPRSPYHVQATSRAFPLRQEADLQRALDELLGERRVPQSFLGFSSHMGRTAGYAQLLDRRMPAEIAPPQYIEVALGRGETVQCLKNGLWLLHEGAEPYAVVLSRAEEFGAGQKLALEVAAPQGERGVAIATQLFEAIERRLTAGSCYRGRVLSLEHSHGRSGHAQRIQVHDLPPLEREALVLPESTLRAIEHNVLDFARQRPALRALGLPAQKGLLFHGAPGVGKTLCIRYLAGRLPGHTTLLITAEQVGLLPEYMALARLLQPALVVIEDADLIARERGSDKGVFEEVMLNRLLNEMDGLSEQADIFFVLTTNNPAALEAALVNRPGRIDQAIEFPLPDDALRRRLIRLYARGLALPEELIAPLAARTQGASPAFLKELMRRIAQLHLEAGGGQPPDARVVESALHEMLFTGGALGRRLLGGAAVADRNDRA